MNIRRDERGFAISAILYTMLVLTVLLMFLALSVMSARRATLNKTSSKVISSLAEKEYDPNLGFTGGSRLLFDAIAYQSVIDNINSKYVDRDPAGVDFTSRAKGDNKNGQGVYMDHTTEKSTYPIYYYRGPIDNNHVLFANYCWRIVRTTETGGIKLLYDGVPKNGSCNNTGKDVLTETSIYWNIKGSGDHTHPHLAQMGYMYDSDSLLVYDDKGIRDDRLDWKYGTDVTYENGKYTLVDPQSGSSVDDVLNNVAPTHHYTCRSSDISCAEVDYIYYIGSSDIYFVPLKDGKNIEETVKKILTPTKYDASSTIKDTLDKWYEAHLTSYTNKLEDTVWCNDLTVASYGSWSKDGDPSKNAYSEGSSKHELRLQNNTRFEEGKPSLSCPKVYAYTVNDTTRGNGKLTYPIGLPTVDELIYAGATKSGSNEDYYLSTGSYYWTMSPQLFKGAYYIYLFTISGSDGNITTKNSYSSSTSEIGLRPMISLKHDTEYEGGNGTADRPYIVK